MTSRDDLLAMLVCPSCREGTFDGLEADLYHGDIRCTACGAVYPVRGGIPILLPLDFDAAHVHDEIDHTHRQAKGHPRGHKQQQAEHYDRAVAEEFEISRPNGAPWAYRWLLREKFRRSITHLPPLRGATVVDACCGSGMDAQMLAQAGARVIAVDISEGCARRAKARADRYGLNYLVVVGDVERLPVRDAAAEISYVHDGLHHLQDPAIGLCELARVASRAVSVNEPADAFGTAVAVGLGAALAEEEAGNRVARIRADDASRVLAAAGFSVRSERYLMYYRHEPGAAMRFASRPPLHRVYRAAVRLADAAIGRWGNKLQVTGLRR